MSDLRVTPKRTAADRAWNPTYRTDAAYLRLIAALRAGDIPAAARHLETTIHSRRRYNVIRRLTLVGARDALASTLPWALGLHATDPYMATPFTHLADHLVRHGWPGTG